MKQHILFSLLCFAIVLNSQTSSAQIWKKVQQKLEEKVEKKVDDVLDGKKKSMEDTTEDGQATGVEAVPNMEERYSFTPGGTIIFADDFKHDQEGKMASYWKSSGGGSVVNVSSVPGNWLALAPNTTYRIDSLLEISANFTIEFDLLTRSVEAKDIGAMQIGFARDNSNRSYIMDAYNDNAITCMQLHFWNKEVTNSSSDTEIYNTLDFPLNNFSNGLLHVAITVEGQHMRIYVNKAKLLDTDMFKKDAVKYFYLSAPFDYKAGAKVFFSNFTWAKL
ncbi:hypothetical protein GCM10023231_34030 [Olivibacter ginsenosidimutans]|uniref:LamG domain-containing protein n=1 Tax=Olivibacter ginsenosidimutans TaxID=1176537 RepID=A0ABP9C1I5_9SPHI